MEKLSLYLQIVNTIGIIIVIILVIKKKSNLLLPTTSVMGTISKRILKTNYYGEFKKFFFEDLPEMLPIPENHVEKINNRVMTEKEMTDDHQFFSKEEAFGLATKIVQDRKEGIVWFEDEGVLCRVHVWHGADGPDVYVDKFAPKFKWNAGARSFFRN